MNRKTILALVAASCAFSMYAYSFKVNVDLSERPEPKDPPKLSVPKGAEKASERYFRFAEKTHPVVLKHGFAAKPEKAKEAVDDPLGDLEPSLVSIDSIQRVDKDVEYIVRSTNGRKSFVLMVVNRKNENMTAEIELKRGKMLEPVYRQVYSEDGGKTWTTAAWQPPRAADVYPWTLEVPSNSVETVTIYLK